MTSDLVREAFIAVEVFAGQRAALMGLINSSVAGQQLDDEGQRYTDMLALAAPGALAWTRRLLRDHSAASIHDTVAERQDVSVAYSGSAEGRKGIAAFRGKRPPFWAVTHFTSAVSS